MTLHDNLIAALRKDAINSMRWWSQTKQFSNLGEILKANEVSISRVQKGEFEKTVKNKDGKIESVETIYFKYWIYKIGSTYIRVSERMRPCFEIGAIIRKENDNYGGMMVVFELKRISSIDEIENLDEYDDPHILQEIEEIENLEEYNNSRILQELEELENLEEYNESRILQELENLEEYNESRILQELEELENLEEYNESRILQELEELENLEEYNESRILQELEELENLEEYNESRIL